MARSQESDIVQILQERYKHQIHSVDQTRDIRTAIAEYMTVLTKQISTNHDAETKFDIPSHVQGLRKRYLQSLQANQEAKARLQHLQTSTTDTLSSSSDTDIYGLHLEVLKLRKEHQKLQILLHYAAEADQIGDHENALTTHARPESAIQVNGHEDVVKASYPSGEIHALEVALLKARHTLHREQRLLSMLKSSHRDVQPTPSTKLNALEATRIELTNWIEISLAKCDVENDTVTTPPMSSIRNPEITNVDIDQQYLKYCQARSRLIESASIIEIPLSAAKEMDSQPQWKQETKPSPSVLPLIESHYLPLWKERALLKQNKTSLNEIISQEQERTRHEMKLLSDESHLLPAYPLLKKTHQRSRSITSASDAVDPVSDLLKAWTFAHEASTISIGETINKMGKESEKSNEAVDATLQALKVSESMWQMLKPDEN